MLVKGCISCDSFVCVCWNFYSIFVLFSAVVQTWGRGWERYKTWLARTWMWNNSPQRDNEGMWVTIQVTMESENQSFSTYSMCYLVSWVQEAVEWLTDMCRADQNEVSPTPLSWVNHNAVLLWYQQCSETDKRQRILKLPRMVVFSNILSYCPMNIPFTPYAPTFIFVNSAYWS